jgi:hypothetical protein
MTILFGRTAAGLVVPILVNDQGELIVEGNDVMLTHSLLDNSLHTDTEDQIPANGSLIVGQHQGGGVYKWGILSGGSTGQVLTKQASGTLAWAAAGAGALVQEKGTQTGAVATGTTTMPGDDTIPQNTEGTQFLTVSITPTSATNMLVIEVSIMFAASAVVHVQAALFQDSVANALAAKTQKALASGDMMGIEFKHRMVAGTISAIDFKVRMGGSAASTITLNGFGGGRIFGGVAASSIIVREVIP